MNDRSAGLWVVLLVALAGVLHVGPVGPQSGGQSEKRTPPAATQPAPLDELNGAEQSVIAELEKFYPVDHKDDSGCGKYFSAGGQSSGKPEKRCAVMDKFKESRSLAVIAMVPDPLDSHAAYRFDETLEALQTGAQEAGYLFDRFALTWPKPGSNPPSDKKDSKAGDFRTIPSVLLFRSRSEPDRVLVMFLVGETPTAGIHKMAMVSALQVSRALLAGQPISEERSRLRVIGPNFSGSVVSLRHADFCTYCQAGPIRAAAISAMENDHEGRRPTCPASAAQGALS